MLSYSWLQNVSLICGTQLTKVLYYFLYTLYIVHYNYAKSLLLFLGGITNNGSNTNSVGLHKGRIFAMISSQCSTQTQRIISRGGYFLFYIFLVIHRPQLYVQIFRFHPPLFPLSTGKMVSILEYACDWCCIVRKYVIGRYLWYLVYYVGGRYTLVSRYFSKQVLQ